MADSRSSVESNSNWVGKISANVKGYEGYFDREIRKDSDHREREYLAQKMDAIKLRLKRSIMDISDSEDLRIFENEYNIVYGFEKMIGEIIYTDYGYASFFDLLKIRKTELVRLYKYDYELNLLLAQMDEIVETLENAVSDGEPVRVLAEQIAEILNKIMQTVRDRKKFIMAVE